MSGLNFTSIIDGSAGRAQGKVGTTIQTFVISLASGFILFSVQFIIFLFVRIHLWAKRIYQPRSFLVPLKNRIKPPPNNPFKWLITVFKIRGPVVLEKSGMDGYFFLRYLSMCLKIFFPMALIIIPILIPINAVGGKSDNIIHGQRFNVTGLDTLAWTNVSTERTDRYWAHLILAIGVIAWVCFLFHHELMNYVRKRHEYLSSPAHRLKASATSVLFSDVPEDLCSVEKLTQHYDDLPGGLRRVWVNRDFSPLEKKVEQRNKLEQALETAETDFLRKCVQRHRKIGKTKGDSSSSGSNSTDKDGVDGESPKSSASHPSRPSFTDEQTPSSGPQGATTVEACKRDLQYELDSNAMWTRYMTPKKRPLSRIPRNNHTILFKIPLLGRLFSSHIDTIYFCRRELARLNVEIEQETELSESYPYVHSAFLQFNTQKAAHLACQGLAHPFPKAMTRRTLELSPGDINWSNLGIPWWQRYIRFGIFIAIFFVIIFVFGLISFFTGILSKLDTLSNSASWLDWVASIPSWLLSFIQGTLPPVILIVLLSGPLPIILRALTNGVQGATTGTQGERSLQLWYFVFLLVELFIIPTISSGLTSVVKELVENIGSVPNILASNLPTAANYYFSFLIVQALSISASSILQTIRLLNYYVIGSTNTPDSVFTSLTFTNRTRIGSNIPWYTTFAVIGLVYSVIAPLIIIFILITFSLYWFVIKNNILYVVRTGDVDGGGLFFPDAINQTFTGLYFMELCLIGLFFLVRDAQGNVACKAHGIIMVVAAGCTILYQCWLRSTFHPLYTYLPVTLEAEAQQRDRDYELERLRSNGDSGDLPEKSHEEQRPQSHDSIPQLRHRSQTFGTSHSYESGRASDIQAQQHLDGQSAKPILARLNRPLDESRLEDVQHHHVRVERAERAFGNVGNALLPRQSEVQQRMDEDPIAKIIMRHNDELEDLSPEERDLLISVAFTHPVIRAARPSVWIPQDGIGVSDDEIRRTRDLSAEVVIDNKGAFFNRKLKVKVDRPPPDMSEFALLMGEL